MNSNALRHQIQELLYREYALRTPLNEGSVADLTAARDAALNALYEKSRFGNSFVSFSTYGIERGTYREVRGHYLAVRKDAYETHCRVRPLRGAPRGLHFQFKFMQRVIEIPRTEWAHLLWDHACEVTIDNATDYVVDVRKLKGPI